MTALADIDFDSVALKSYKAELNPRARLADMTNGNLSVRHYFCTLNSSMLKILTSVRKMGHRKTLFNFQNKKWQIFCIITNNFWHTSI